MKTPSHVLSLDLGTTGVRAIAFDRARRPAAAAYREFPQYYPRPGWVEHDALEIWGAVRRCLSGVFARVAPSRIAAVGITNQRETVVVWDRRDGRPLHRAIVWQCRRTADDCRALRKRGLEPLIRRKTGLFLDAYFSATKLAWLLRHVPSAARLARQGHLAAGTIDSWVLWKLTGGRVHGTDPSNASRTMLYDLRARDWDPELLSIFGVPEGVLPALVPTSGPIAVTDRSVTGAPLPVTGLVGDQQAAAFAQGCLRPGIVKNTYGTGLFIVEHAGRRVPRSRDLLATVAWAIGDPRRTEYALEGSVFVGGAAVQWLRDGLGIIGSAGQTASMAASLSGNDDVYFVPALVGLGAPYWDPDARGLLVGLTRGTTRAHLVRAALESIAYQTRDTLETMQRDTCRKIRLLRVDGGASANDFLMQFQADLIGIPVERPAVLETTALGAAALAGLASGFWKSRAQFDASGGAGRTFRPRMSRPDAERLYRRWKQAVRRSRGWARSDTND